jgi:RNA polymerase sigma-70 factor (ECF subfamily)
VNVATPTPLVATYFARRNELRRFFLARGRTPAEADSLTRDLYTRVCSDRLGSKIAARGARWLGGPDEGASLAAGQRLRQALTALDALPAKTQEVFRLSRFEGLNYAEIGDKLAMSPNAVENHMVEALRKLVAQTNG